MTKITTITTSISELSIESLALYLQVANELKNLETERLAEWSMFDELYPSVAAMQGVKDKWLMDHAELQIDDEIEIVSKLLNIKESPIEGAFAVSVDTQANTITWIMD